MIDAEIGHLVYKWYKTLNIYLHSYSVYYLEQLVDFSYAIIEGKITWLEIACINITVGVLVSIWTLSSIT